MPKTLLHWTALYERLSRDDEQYGDSVSIEHQKAYLAKYAMDHGLTLIHHYTDDGWTGGNFDRPAWSQLIADVEAGKIETVLVKDMSRVGRDHLQTGFYTEIFFNQHNVHFIAIDNHVDNMSQTSNEFAPMLNVFNELYLHDLSRKCAIGFHSRGISGKPLMYTPCFGYVRDPADGNHWLIDPEAADTVRRIYQLAADGVNPNKIAAILREEGRIKPGAYFRQKGQNNRCFAMKDDTDPFSWTRGAVRKILQRKEYLGHTVNFKTGKASYKSKRKELPESNRRIFNDTHEAIVDQATWDRAQLVLDPHRKDKSAPVANPFGKRIICAHCGAPMYDIHYDQKMPSGNVCHQEFMRCSTYHNSVRLPEKLCVNNTITTRRLRALMSQAIQLVSRNAITNEDAFRDQLQKLAAVQPEEDRPLRTRIADTERRIVQLNLLLKKLYEDFALGRISGETYDKLSAGYEEELSQITETLSADQDRLEQLRQDSSRAEQFLALANRFRDCADYTDETLCRFIDRVIVHQSEKDADGEKSQQVEIFFAFIDDFPIPVEPVVLTPEEEKRQAQLKYRRIHERDKRAKARQEREAAKLTTLSKETN